MGITTAVVVLLVVARTAAAQPATDITKTARSPGTSSEPPAWVAV